MSVEARHDRLRNETKRAMQWAALRFSLCLLVHCIVVVRFVVVKTLDRAVNPDLKLRDGVMQKACMHGKGMMRLHMLLLVRPVAKESVDQFWFWRCCRCLNHNCNCLYLHNKKALGL